MANSIPISKMQNHPLSRLAGEGRGEGGGRVQHTAMISIMQLPLSLTLSPQAGRGDAHCLASRKWGKNHVG